jgi:hypothetical protein
MASSSARSLISQAELLLTDVAYRPARLSLSWSISSHTSTGQCLDEKRQAFVHPVIDTGMVVGELLVAMRNAESF